MLYIVRVTEHRDRLPREVAESPSLVTLKINLVIVLDNLLYMVQLDHAVVGQMISGSPFNLNCSVIIYGHIEVRY